MNAALGEENDRDRIAIQAAILIETGRVARISEAIRSAADALGVTQGPMPSHAAVRKHAQAMAMQAMGEADYRASRLQVLRIAEELMTLLDQAGFETLLSGRAAAGHLDADVKLHIRVYTDAAIGELAKLLVDFGYEEPQFETAETRYGRLDRMLLVDEGIPIILTRCPPRMNIERRTSTFSGKAVASATLEQLRRMIHEQ